MKRTYFGFAVADGMFPPHCLVARKEVQPDEAVEFLDKEEIIPCLNPNHQSTITAMVKRYGINIEIPETPPKVYLNGGDRILVMSVRGLPRLGREYTDEEIASATFSFGLWTIQSADLTP